MRVAVIENGVVTNIIEADTVSVFGNTVDAMDCAIGDSWDGISFTKPAIVPVIEVPQSVTPRQARLALLQATLLDEVELLLANDKAMQIWWEYSLEIDRNHEHIIMMGMALGLTAIQLDDLFVLAATL